MASQEQAGQTRARLVLPQMRLDDLLAELQSRLDVVRATRDRVHALLEAVFSIGGELDLEAVLRRITEAAATLADARYGALGVIGEDGELAEFVTVGVTEDEIRAIKHWPHGHGILGLLIKEPQVLRLPDISAHLESYGFPADHPPMRRFLGVPIRVRDEVFGNLYLTEKVGGGEFEDDDEIAVTALAGAAGVAIENARLYQDTRRRERWLAASGEVSTALLSGTDAGEVLTLVARRAREICDAGVSFISLPDRDELTVMAALGDNAEVLNGMRAPIDGTACGRVYSSGESLSLATAGDDPAIAKFVGSPSFGPMLLVPLGATGAVRGVLGVANPVGGPDFPRVTLRIIEAFGAQAAVALEVAERRRDAERLVVLEDRDRIAKDLHDTVIQRLFATAMTLMSAAKMIEKQDAGARVRRGVEDLDTTIRQIRSTIFALQTLPEQEGLRTRVRAVVDAASESLGFAPVVRLDGPLDTAVLSEIAEQLLAVLGEALSNVVRHARATEVVVTIELDDRLSLRVVDNGVGIPAGGRRSGLRNMADRARVLGGLFEARPREQGGTALHWIVPLLRAGV